MKTKIIKKITLLVLTCLAMLCFSCPGASPIFGTWADASGNQITFVKDGSFSSSITSSSTGKLETMSGTFSVQLNVLVFDSSSGQRILSEWDIRGAMMYLTWTDTTGKTKALTLYKTK